MSAGSPELTKGTSLPYDMRPPLSNVCPPPCEWLSGVQPERPACTAQVEQLEERALHEVYFVDADDLRLKAALPQLSWQQRDGVDCEFARSSERRFLQSTPESFIVIAVCIGSMADSPSAVALSASCSW